MTKNIHYVNNTSSDLRAIWPIFEEAYKTGVLHEDYADFFLSKYSRATTPTEPTA